MRPFLITLLLALLPGRAICAEPPTLSIAQVSHAPREPHSGQTVTVTAQVSSPAKVSAVTLLYQVVEPGHYLRKTDEAYEKEWHPLPMVAGEAGAYTVQVPAALQQHRRLLRYRITATDEAGATLRAPAATEEVPNLAWFTYDGHPAWKGASRPGKTPVLTFPPSLLNSLPALTLLADDSDVEHSQWDGGWNKRKVPGTVILGGTVYDHIVFHNRGQASVYGAGKNKWGFHFHHGAEVTPPPSWGRPFSRPWNSISLNSCASPWVASNRGMAGLDEAISYRAYELAGVPAPRTVPVQLRVISTEAEAAEQYKGDLWGLYMMVEDPDGAFLAARGLAEGTVYKGTGETKHVSTAGPPEPLGEYDRFREKLGGKQSEEWWRTHLDLPAFYGFHAANLLLGNVDLREGDNHYLYHRPAGPWTVLPWDLDMMFIPKSHQSGRVEEDRCLENAVLHLEYQNRCREILDLLCSDGTPEGGQFGQLVAEYVALLHPPGEALGWPELDECRWNYHPRTNEKGSFYKNPVRGGPDGNWKRILATADFAGFARFVTEFCTPARPAERPWRRDDGDPRGYGYGYLASEAEDPAIPETPVLRAVGPPRELRFECTPYAGREAFAAGQWRLGGLSAASPCRYEIESAWVSPELPEEKRDFTFPPPAAAGAGGTLQARVRVKDRAGHWSHWSAPVGIMLDDKAAP